MADPGITATFSDLPTEMKATIFGYLRQNDHKKSACLVSRGWRDIMAPILWEHLTLEIATTLPGELACLLNPNDGVLAHVRSIDIRPGLDDPEEFELNSEFGIAFRLIFGALQKNCLSTLRFYIDISMTTLLSVLQSQQALETLRLQGLTSNGSLSNDLCLATHSSWVTPTLRNIRYLRVTVGDGEQNTYEHSAFLVKNTPKLKYLNLDGFVDPLPDWYGNDALGEPGAATQSLQLDHLQLSWLDLETYPASLFTVIDFSVLRDLLVMECDNVGAFLTALVPGASQVPALKRLEMVSSLLPPSDASLQAIETLVTSTPSLQTLWLDVGKGRLIDVACLAGHGNTLKRLGLAASSRTQGPYYSALDLDKLLTQAPKLVDLAVSLCPINLGHVRHLGAKFKLFKQTGNDYVLSETEFLLIRIAKHQNLQSLRILTLPSIDYGMIPNPNIVKGIDLPDEHVYTSKVMMQAFATEVFRLLARNGSNIRALAISPQVRSSTKRPVSDDNGHRWPRYYYRYDVTGAMSGQEHVVAVPTPPAEFPIPVPT
ncbi:hypothetical protein CC77DRAFT_1100163 [Alternaria alternata]|uniref:F-box domain-containing protein n=1 Tax=Alternaria alternata TaxID=5599 RepID=A0A177D394_ALTAL|nr:hypothetical protein CC77DRAFT_1100163 [Alternaria alternata]KAH6846050.1 hypothetical protein B0T12DRAFT_516156 [Alternaria alternata]OAG14155.1 hypothetical protein CC77DRAFT_1100163 [Alternaria alternata]RYN74660.1 hypothetical protein AA0120_g12316 [Alternaria tenuissima]